MNDFSNLKFSTTDIDREIRRRKINNIETYFPDTGPLRRELYKKHLEFFEAGIDNRERTVMAANRVGKTEGMGGYEVALHASGKYPDWWKGKRFKKAVKILAAGETSKLVRDSIQLKLLGPYYDKGTGLIRLDDIKKTTPKNGIPDAVDQIHVSHASGSVSIIQFQSYDQGREVFQATEYDIIWLDEEPPLNIYAECLIRTTTTKGIIISTFTPLKGMSETVLSLMEKEKKGIGVIIKATWDDAPHLSEQTKKELFDSLPPHQREARTKGVPSLGSGAIYPILEEFLVVDDIPVPDHWTRAYGMDVGWNNTAALWIAWDREKDIVYVTGEYKRGQAEPPSHAQAIKAQGDWIPGVIDPASAGSNQADGKKLAETYKGLGLKLSFADNTVEAGILEVYTRMVSGRLKIFKSCTKLLEEFRLYRRDEKGQIVKKDDHLMDTLRYAIMSGLKKSKTHVEQKAKIMPGQFSSNMGVY